MNEQDLWWQFATSGRVEDYLRYRGVEVPPSMNAVTEEGTYGDDKTASHDRRAHRTGIPNRRGE